MNTEDKFYAVLGCLVLMGWAVSVAISVTLIYLVIQALLKYLGS